MLESGTLKPGETRFPRLRKMSTTMGVSVATVSQAYLELEKQGMLESRERSGFYVRESYRTPPPPEKVVQVQAPATVQRGELIRKVLDTVGRVLNCCRWAWRNLLRVSLPVKASGKGHEHRSCPTLWRPGDDLSAHSGRQRAARGTRPPNAAVTVLPCRPDDLLITAGAMEALSVAMRAVTRPGDTVAICTPTYHCLLVSAGNNGIAGH